MDNPSHSLIQSLYIATPWNAFYYYFVFLSSTCTITLVILFLAGNSHFTDIHLVNPASTLLLLLLLQVYPTAVTTEVPWCGMNKVSPYLLSYHTVLKPEPRTNLKIKDRVENTHTTVIYSSCEWLRDTARQQLMCREGTTCWATKRKDSEGIRG